jgi:flagellar export protein FliJ
MNWSTLLRFRKRVEEMAREAMNVAEWEKQREESSREKLQQDMQKIALELERNLRSGVGKIFAEQRFRWLEETGDQLELQSTRIQEIEQKVEGLRKKLSRAHHARRVVELVIEKKESAIMREIAKQEQRVMEEAVANRQVGEKTRDHGLLLESEK